MGAMHHEFVNLLLFRRYCHYFNVKLKLEIIISISKVKITRENVYGNSI